MLSLQKIMGGHETRGAWSKTQTGWGAVLPCPPLLKKKKKISHRH